MLDGRDSREFFIPWISKNVLSGETELYILWLRHILDILKSITIVQNILKIGVLDNFPWLTTRLIYLFLVER